MIVVEHAAEPLPTLNRPVGLIVSGLHRPDELAVQALVESLFQIMRHVLLNDVPKMPLAEEYEVVQALVLAATQIGGLLGGFATA